MKRAMSTTYRSMADGLEALLRDRMEAAAPFRLVELYRQWPDVVGGELAESAKPLGHRKQTLVLGSEDSYLLQELPFHAPYILECVNRFLGERFFEKVKGELIGEKKTLDNPPVAHVHAHVPPPAPRQLGSLVRTFSPDSPVARCYERYVELMAGRQEEDLTGNTNTGARRNHG